MSKETCYSVKRDLVQCQKRPRHCTRSLLKNIYGDETEIKYFIFLGVFGTCCVFFVVDIPCVVDFSKLAFNQPIRV